MDEEWNQRRADNRSPETMRRIALDAMAFKDDDAAFYTYAEKNHLTVDEVVYYLNTYEYGGEAGLQAIHNPDIVTPEVARRAMKTVAQTFDAHFQGRLSYRITDEGTGIGVYQIQQRMSGEKYLFAICQLRLTVDSNQWHLYWMRKFDAWWPYPPPVKGRKYTLKARLQQVLDDEFGCFWV
jgi:hypothetical protein